MIVNFATSDVAARIETGPSLRFELFYCLHQLASGADDEHDRQILQLPREVVQAQMALGGHPIVWIVVNDALGRLPATANLDQITQSLRRGDARTFATDMLTGLLHDRSVARELVTGKIDLKTALGALPPAKGAWLSHIGLFPFRAHGPMAKAIAKLCQEPRELQNVIRHAIAAFWQAQFATYWNTTAELYVSARGRIDSVVAENNLAPLFDGLNLPARFDAEALSIVSRRGDFALPLERVKSIHIMPSAFNVHRLWTVHDEGRAATAYFPLLDTELAKTARHTLTQHDRSAYDLARIFQALGAEHRLAIADLLAERPRTAAELADALGLARSTLSHHLTLMREAGLLHSARNGGGLELSLNRPPFEALTRGSLARFFIAPDAANSDDASLSRRA